MATSLVMRDGTALPQCAQGPALYLLSSAGCAAGDWTCACHSRTFLAGLQYSIKQSCPHSDIVPALSSARKYCATLIPGLNDNRHTELTTPIVIFMILAIFAVMLRFYARRISKAHLGWDDWFAFASLIFGVATDILDLYGLRHGEARHRFMADLSSVVISQKPLLATMWMLTASVLSLKLSILALYRRISPTLTRFRNVLIVSGIVIAVLELVTALVYTFSCFPLVFLWEMMIPGGSCWNGQYVNVAWCAADLLTGIWVLVLSIPVLKDLDAGGKRKIAVPALLVIGGFVCVAAAVRISLLVLLDGNDASRSAVPYTIWTTLEVNIGIISVCLPCLRPLHRVSNCLSKRSASRSNPIPRSLETRKKTYGRHSENKSTNGVWTTSATSGGADQERILGKDVETWPMSSIGITKEVDISRDRSFV